MELRGDESRDVRHVDHEERADIPGNLAERPEIQDTRVCARPRDDERGTLPLCLVPDEIVVDPPVLLPHPVGAHPVENPGGVDRRAVREMPPMAELHPEDSVPGSQEREVGRHVRLCPRMRLHVGVLRPVELPRTRAGQLLDAVHELTSSVVAPAREALGVLVREDGPRGIEHGTGHEVLRRDELELITLAAKLPGHGPVDLRIRVPQVHIGLRHGGWDPPLPR